MKKGFAFLLFIIAVLFASNLFAIGYNGDIVFGQVYHYELIITDYTGPNHMIPVFDWIKVFDSGYILNFEVKDGNSWVNAGFTICDTYGNYIFSVNNVDFRIIDELIAANGYITFRLTDFFGNQFSDKTFDWDKYSASIYYEIDTTLH